MSEAPKVLQPLHPSILPRLDSAYVEFHNKHIAHAPALNDIPWHPDTRLLPAVLGGSEPLKVGSTRDFDLSKTRIRVFTPEGEAPAAGWPVFVFFHGGGWTLGRIDTENAFSTNMCKHANAVVVSVDYRLGPEVPYPAAVDDAWESIEWILKNGKTEINVDTTRIAVGGSSSGGNLAAIVTHKAALANPPIPLVFQLLVVPVVDNTATVEGVPHASWVENQHVCSLTPAKMLWFRRNYLPNPEDWNKWEASPIFAPEEAFKRSPKAWIGVAELDILRDEGIAYGEKLKSFGVDVEVKVYKKSPHPIMAMDGKCALESGKQLVADAANALARAFGTA